MSEQILINGSWRDAKASKTFRATNPATGETTGPEFPVSTWADCDAALDAARTAYAELAAVLPAKIAAFLEAYAASIEANADELCKAANEETALPVAPRLKDVELPRTVNQIRQSAGAAREMGWCRATIDTKTNIRSCLASLGPVVVMGPNNFPFAYNGIAGGDFAGAIAAGNSVIAKAHPMHPRTTQLFARLAKTAADETGMPAATVQLIYTIENEDGLKLVADPRIEATGFTGSRAGGLKLKAAADAGGKLTFLEMSSINPVAILPGALAERGDDIAAQFAQSCLMATGQMCTNPGLVLLVAGAATEKFIATCAELFAAAPAGVLLGAGVRDGLMKSVTTLEGAGAKLVTGGKVETASAAYRFANTLLRVDGQTFLKDVHTLQTEAFGNASMFVVCVSADELVSVVEALEGNLTGSVYSDTRGSDDAAYAKVAAAMADRVGRFLNDKMPTGVAVVSSMNHGGPYPATGHPGFTAVGVPGSVARFSRLRCFDNVREARLPDVLKNKNPTGNTWRLIDGVPTTADLK